MPRYAKEQNIVFTDITGKSYELKPPQEIPSLSYVFGKEIEISKGDQLDEIAQRTDIYGENSEALWYKIFDFNLVRIVENGFSLDGIKSLKIPI